MNSGHDHADEKHSAALQKPTTDGRAIEDRACLRMIDRVRRRSGSRDGDWLFSTSQETPAADDTPVSRSAGSRISTLAQIGRFRIERRLGSGGYGTVFLAMDPKLNRHVALKVPAPDVLLKDELRSRFLREGEASAALSHPHIVTIHEAGQIGAINYIAFEYVEGGTLADWLRLHKSRLPCRDAAALIRILAEAVQHAHSRGVLHRDIKPGNIMLECQVGLTLASTDLCHAARLTDFGLARFENPHTECAADTSTESILGTPAYMSPEQAEGRNSDVDTTSDVYALGVILYELLVGDPPFRKATRVATLKAIWCEDVVPPSRRGIEVPSDLEAICLKCLQKEKTERYQTAAALAEDLQRFLNHEPVTARRLRSWESLLRYCRRKPGIAALTATVVSLVMLLAVGSTIASVILTQANDRTLDSLEKEIAAKDEATQSEKLALRALFEARIQQSRAVRGSGRPGQRFESLKAIASAAKHRERLKLDDADRAALRTEIVAARALVDLELTQRWPGIPPLWAERVGFDPQIQRYARWESDGRVVVRRLVDNEEVAALPQTYVAKERPEIVFSPDDQVLAVRSRDAGANASLKLWDLRSLTEPVLSVPSGGLLSHPTTTFSADGRLIATTTADDSIAIWDVQEKVMKAELKLGWSPLWLRLNPTGTILAVSAKSAKSVHLVDVGTAELGAEVFMSTEAWTEAAWSHDGRLLATGGEHGYARVWNLQRKAPVATFKGHFDKVLNIAFTRNDRILLTSARDSSVRLWDVEGRRSLLQAHGQFEEISSDDGWLSLAHSGVAVGRWRLAAASDFITLPGKSSRSTPLQLAFSPDGRLLACGSYTYGVEIWDTDHLQKIGALNAPARSVAFAPDGKGIFVGGYRAGIQKWPINFDATQPDALVIDNPQVFAESRYRHSNLSLSKDCQLALLNHSADEAAVYDLVHGKKLLNLQSKDLRYHAVSPDAQWIATGSWLASGVKIWNAESGELVRDLPVEGPARVVFSPDGKTMVTCSAENYECWKTQDWTSQYRIPAHGNVYCCAAFTNDSKTLAVAQPNGVLLADASTGTEIVSLLPPFSITARSMAFRPDRTQLAVGASSGLVYLWHMDRLRTGLQTKNLDWNPPVQTSKKNSEAPVELQMPQWLASSSWGSSKDFVPARAFDTFTASRWNSRKGDMSGAWLEIRWPAARTIRSVTIHEAFDRIRGFRLQHRPNDSEDWVDLYIAEGKAFHEIAGTISSTDHNDESVNPIREVKLSKPVMTSELRVLVTDTVPMRNSSISIREMQVRD